MKFLINVLSGAIIGASIAGLTGFFMLYMVFPLCRKLYRVKTVNRILTWIMNIDF